MPFIGPFVRSIGVIGFAHCFFFGTLAAPATVAGEQCPCNQNKVMTNAISIGGLCLS